MSQARARNLSGWGRAQRRVAPVLSPAVEDDLAVQVASCSDLLTARGAGCSYGDAALPPRAGTTVVDTTRRNRVLDVDLERGLVIVQSGATLRELQSLVVPHGWTVPVLPGTARVTVGGAVASDVHAKNQPGATTFGHHVQWLTLVRADGTTLRLAPDHRSGAYWATVGGMGLTGVIDLICLRLAPIPSPLMLSRRQRTDDLDETMRLLEERARLQSDDPGLHAVAWLDGSAGPRAGRGVVETAHHLAAGGRTGRPDGGYAACEHRAASRSLPGPGVIGRRSIRAANRLRWWVAARPAEQVASVSRTLHPLDRADAWPAAFGSAGLVQYQFVLPASAREALREVLGAVNRAGCPPALATLKRFTSTPSALLAFAVPGWSLALDFPARWTRLYPLLRDLDALVADRGGRVYLTKDSRLSPQAVRRMYPALEQWQQERRLLDPDGRWVSGLGTRTGLVTAPVLEPRP